MAYCKLINDAAHRNLQPTDVIACRGDVCCVAVELSVPATNLAVVIAEKGGAVVSQNRQAQQLLGKGVGRTCWDLVGSLDSACGLECRQGCVAELVNKGADHAAYTPFQLSGRAYHLMCVPQGDRVVCVLSSGKSETPQAWNRLTPRERQVLRLIADGESSTAVAEKLGVSQGTIRTHVEHMRNKLGVTTRAALVARGFRLGYLD